MKYGKAQAGQNLTSLANKVLVAGKGFELPGIKVINFTQPGAYSFYESLSPPTSLQADSPETGEPRNLVRPRYIPPPKDYRPPLGGCLDADCDPDKLIQDLKGRIKSVVLHTPLTCTSAQTFRILKERALSTHFMIEGDGVILQATDVVDVALHCGMPNPVSVGVDLSNVQPNLAAGAEIPGCMQGRPVSDVMVINGVPWKSTGFTDRQYDSLTALIRLLMQLFDIPAAFPLNEQGGILPEVMALPASTFSGILCHWHIKQDKFDPGPGLDWQRILARLRSGQETAGIPVEIKELKGLPAPATAMIIRSETKATQVADRFYQNAEHRAHGGFYPIGINQTWHNGIHLATGRGTKVHPIFAGEVVAARFTDEHKDIGSSNFVLMRHRLNVQTESDQKAVVRPFTFYSLYMHLAAMDLDNPPDDLRWLSTVKRVYQDKDPIKTPPSSRLPETAEKCNQFQALRLGYVAMFGEDDATKIPVDTTQVIGMTGSFGLRRTRRNFLHLEVFSDDTWLDAVDPALNGDMLLLGPDEPDAKDLVVESPTLLSLFGKKDTFLETLDRTVLPTGKQFSRAQIRRFFTSPYHEGAKSMLRKLVVRHVSEWSTQVSWISALTGREDWFLHFFGPGERNLGMYRTFLARYMPLYWLSDKVIANLGLKTQGQPGVLYFFHPVTMMVWGTYRRSVMRGKTVEEIIRDINKEFADKSHKHGQKAEDIDDSHGIKISGPVTDWDSYMKDVMKQLQKIPGRGEW